MLLTTENIILIGALLLLVSVFAGKVAYRFGAPALLLFLGVGMLFGLRLISFNSAPVAQFVGMVALCIILFSGGMDTRYRAIRPVIGPGVVLATVGVALTALIVAGFVYVVAPWCNLLRAGAAAGRHDVLERLGVGLLDPAQPQAGVERESETVAGARKRQ